jgi:ribosomal protein S18 acetylase RimI-like enzyme
MTVVSYGVALVGFVGTRVTARGRGLGEAVTRAVTNTGFDMGARLASLQASPEGDAIYRRLGYVEVSRYREYLAPEREG